MKLTFKPLLIILFALLTPSGVWADVEIDGIYYNLVPKSKIAEVTNGGSLGRYSGNIVIPNSVQYQGVTYDVRIITTDAFSASSSLISVEIPNSVTKLANRPFGGCKNLKSVIIGNGVTDIGWYIFEGCSSLTTVIIGNSVKTIGSRMFYDCTSLTSVEIPNNVTSIGEAAFEGCSNLVSVTIGNSVKYIESGAFGNCSSLTSLDIPSSVVFIGSHAFTGCSSLASVKIPNNITVIEESTFYGCTSLTSVSIPNSVIAIGRWAFWGCTSLKSLEIPNSVKCIGGRAFYECSGLERITIGSGVIDIGVSSYYSDSEGKEHILSYNGEGNTFAKCKNLIEVKCLAENVPSTNSNTFDESFINYATLYVPESSINNYKSITPWSRFFTIKPLEMIILFADDAVEALCLANWDVNQDGELSKEEAAAVTDLGSVFANNSDITSFDELQYFTGLTSIGEQAFYYCSNLNSIIIPENVSTIGNRAFYVCSGLKSLRIPANVSNIEDRAFAYCSGLETIEVDEKNQYYDSRNNCNALIQTSSNTLLVGSKNSVIPDGVISIGEGAFRGCTELTNIVIPEGVKTIGMSAFRGCTGLTSVSLPSTITSIGNYAFSAFDEVYNLTTVTVGMTSPVTIASEVFPNRANSILYVPKGSRPAYKAANYWKEFKQIIELEDGVPVKCEKPTITFFASGKIKVESATEGAKCITNITASNVEPLTDGEISLNTPLTVYTVKAYATAEGYADSDEATATFRWEKTEGDMNGDGTVNIADVVQLVNMFLGN